MRIQRWSHVFSGSYVICVTPGDHSFGLKRLDTREAVQRLTSCRHPYWFSSGG
jgi:hypothetical protein